MSCPSLTIGCLKVKKIKRNQLFTFQWIFHRPVDSQLHPQHSYHCLRAGNYGWWHARMHWWTDFTTTRIQTHYQWKWWSLSFAAVGWTVSTQFLCTFVAIESFDARAKTHWKCNHQSFAVSNTIGPQNRIWWWVSISSFNKIRCWNVNVSIFVFLFFFSKFRSVSRRILVIFQLEILKPGNEIDFLIGQPDRANVDFTNNLSEMVGGLTLRPSNSQYDADDDSIHFREFDELDIFRSWCQCILDNQILISGLLFEFIHDLLFSHFHFLTFKYEHNSKINDSFIS